MVVFQPTRARHELFEPPENSSFGPKLIFKTVFLNLKAFLNRFPLAVVITHPSSKILSRKVSIAGRSPATFTGHRKTRKACLCFQCIYQNSIPPYISDLLHPYRPSRTLRSLDTSLLTVPRFSLETFGKKSFSVFGPTVWNSLPLSLRKSQCFTTFKAKLKTHLFRTHLC